MSLYDILNDSPNLNVTINGGQLIEAIDYAITKAKAEFSEESKPERLLNRNETSKKLGVDPSTMYRWNKSGYLTPVRVGARVMYRESDIERILEGGKTA